MNSTRPQSLVGLNISQLLTREDKDVFSIATKEMLADESKTVEVVFHVVPSGDNNKVPFKMEGKGMLMYNRVTSEPSHTMWVIKSLGSRRWSTTIMPSELTSDSSFITQQEEEIQEDHHHPIQPDVLPVSPAIKNIQSIAMRRAISHGGVPVSRSLDAANTLLSIPPALCNICERWVVAAFFEQHSELCVEIHRAEMDVCTCNDSLIELKHYVQGLCDITTSEVKELESNPNKTFDIIDEEDDETSLHSDQDSIFGETLPLDEDKASPLEKKRAELESYVSLLDIMNVALSISTPDTPGTRENEEKLAQCILSKSKIIQILYWRPPLADDPDIKSLIQDIEMITKSKVDAVNRMQNCLEYNERTRNDFQHNVMQTNNWSEFVTKTNESTEENQEKEVVDQPTPAALPPPPSPPQQQQKPVAKANLKTAQQPSPPILNDVMEEEKGGHHNIKKTIFKKIKDWKSKGKRGNNSSNNKQSKRLSKRKNAANIPPPVSTTSIPKTPATKIVEMETIDTPIHSPKFPSTNTVVPPRKSSLPNQQRIQQQSSGSSTPSLGKSPLSPLPAPMTSNRPVAPSIKDFDIIKPISKGAFGSVFLAKKRVTGDYYAIKFLKKSDMIAKNQVTNVKAERMILMTQTDSPYVTKLYYTFQSKDYLYLVLEYLNGGDCSSLIKVLGHLSCDWARNYLAEVTLGLSFLHDKQIIHR